MASPRVLGVLGTLVRDTIHRDDEGAHESTDAWGGIAYALESFTAGLAQDWEIVPLVKVGADLAKNAEDYLSGLPRARVGPGLVQAAARNPRVELRYVDGVRVSEKISHLPPAWSWSELEPLLSECDALYVNFITGFEMELETALRVRAHFQGPIFADLHSLFLALDEEGRRSPRTLPEAERWLGAFDAVQVNESEFHLLFAGDGSAGDGDSGMDGDPWRWAAKAVGSGVSLITVTLEDRGAAYVATPGLPPDPFEWVRLRGRAADKVPAEIGSVEQRSGPIRGDSTGCGDVWGSALFARLLGGESLEAAMEQANGMAARKLGHSGADGLAHHLARASGTGVGEPVEGESTTRGGLP